MPESDLIAATQAERDSFAQQIGQTVARKRPAVVTAGYNINTGDYVAAANFRGSCAEACVIDALGGDASAVRFVNAVRPRDVAPPLSQVDICLICEATYGRDAFVEPGTIFKSDTLFNQLGPYYDMGEEGNGSGG